MVRVLIAMLVLLVAGTAVARRRDDGFYEYKDEHGKKVLVQGFKNVPVKYQSSVKEITVSADHGETPEVGPVYLEKGDAKPTTTCADKDVRASWKQMIPTKTVSRISFALAVLAMIGFAVWLFLKIQIVVWLRALLTMSPFIVAVAGLGLVADRMAAWRQCDQASGVTNALLKAHQARLDAMDRAIERETR